ncbi:hypothetical protein N657DRAFT_250544 [Parathielavia appendiculata]|uniref:Uncharacterized protein n=1 Tax=Parathielavia appendiculata TaxID=2587402 RepID=A0AAN6YZS3_9PEZI|nr:hypothetical protein N657DRAFT_250544 [Parathielavia appendiculata]
MPISGRPTFARLWTSDCVIRHGLWVGRSESAAGDAESGAAPMHCGVGHNSGFDMLEPRDMLRSRKHEKGETLLILSSLTPRPSPRLSSVFREELTWECVVPSLQRRVFVSRIGGALETRRLPDRADDRIATEGTNGEGIGLALFQTHATLRRQKDGALRRDPWINDGVRAEGGQNYWNI